MTKAYKYRGGIGILDKDGKSIFERDVNTIVNNQIYLPTKCKLNDPTEGFFNDAAIITLLEQLKNYSSEVKKQYNRLLEKFENVGVYSLSKNNDNELLWAYYASGHTGFAIEYDIDNLKESLNHNRYFQLIFDFNVDYVQSIPKADISVLQSKDFNHIIKTYLGSKSLSWKHENEYRLIFEGKELFDIDYRAITGMYFGYRMKDQEIDFIMEKLKGRNLNYYKMNLIDSTYKFKPIKIEDNYRDAIKYIANNLSYDDWYLHEDFMGETYKYRDKLIEVLEIVKYEPLITEIDQAIVDVDSEEPVFKVFAYTGAIPSVKSFVYKLDSKGKLVKIS